MKVHEFFEKDMKLIKSLVKLGIIPLSYMSYYKIYQTFMSCTDLESKRKRHFYTSDVLNTSLSTVIRALRIMESKLK